MTEPDSKTTPAGISSDTERSLRQTRTYSGGFVAIAAQDGADNPVPVAAVASESTHRRQRPTSQTVLELPQDRAALALPQIPDDELIAVDDQACGAQTAGGGRLGPVQELLDRSVMGTERRVGLKSRELATHQTSNGPGCKIDLILHGPLLAGEVVDASEVLGASEVAVLDDGLVVGATPIGGSAPRPSVSIALHKPFGQLGGDATRTDTRQAQPADTAVGPVPVAQQPTARQPAIRKAAGWFGPVALLVAAVAGSAAAWRLVGQTTAAASLGSALEVADAPLVVPEAGAEAAHRDESGAAKPQPDPLVAVAVAPVAIAVAVPAAIPAAVPVAIPVEVPVAIPVEVSARSVGDESRVAIERARPAPPAATPVANKPPRAPGLTNLCQRGAWVVQGTAADAEAPYLALRDQPRNDSKLLAKLSDGTRVGYGSRQGRWIWAQVCATGQSGWLNQKWLAPAR